MTEPCALVVSSAFGTFVIARLVVVALVAKMLVADAKDAKKLVEVALVVVPLRAIKSVSVVEPNTARPPRVKIPEAPTLIPPPMYASPPTLRLSVMFAVLLSSEPILAAGNFAPLMSTTLSVVLPAETYAYLPAT